MKASRILIYLAMGLLVGVLYAGVNGNTDISHSSCNQISSYAYFSPELSPLLSTLTLNATGQISCCMCDAILQDCSINCELDKDSCLNRCNTLPPSQRPTCQRNCLNWFISCEKGCHNQWRSCRSNCTPCPK